MTANDIPLHVPSLDELVQLARRAKAEVPHDPAVDAKLHEAALASGGPFWGQILNQVLGEIQSASGSTWWPAVKKFLWDWVWGLIKSKGGVALLSLVTGVLTLWAARPERPAAGQRADAISPAEVRKEFDATTDDLEKKFDEKLVNGIRFGEVRSIVNSHRDKIAP